MNKSNVNPSHYNDHPITPLDLMASYGLAFPFAIGNVIKYVTRAPEKNGHEDLCKALWYLMYALGFSKEKISELTEEANAIRSKNIT